MFRALQSLRIFSLVYAFLLPSLLLGQNDTTAVENTSESYVNVRINIDSTGHPVLINRDTVLTIFISTGSLTVQHRAEILSERLTKLAETWQANKDTFALIESDQYIRILKDEYTVIEIYQPEAEYANLELMALAKERSTLITNSLNTQLSGAQLSLQFGLAFIVIVAVLLIIHLILKFLFGVIIKQIAKHKGTYIRGIKIRDFELMDANEELQVIIRAVGIIRLLVMLVLASIAFPIIFSFFPATKFIAYTLLGYVYDPVVNLGISVINYLPNLFAIIVIVYFVRLILKYIKMVAKRVEYGRIKIKGFYPDWSRTTYEIVRILIIALALVMVFPYLPGAQSDVFKGVSVFIGIIFSIGSTSVVGNLVSGLVMTYMRPFTIGDRIKIGEIEGEIIEKTPFVLRIKTPKNEHITMPNSNVLSSHIVNYNQSFEEGGVILFTDVTIGYDVEWRKVHELLLRAARETDYLEKEPEPFVLQEALENFSVRYQVNAYTKKPLYKDLIYSLLHQKIQDIFNEAGIEITSPNYVTSRPAENIVLPERYKKQKSSNQANGEDEAENKEKDQ